MVIYKARVGDTWLTNGNGFVCPMPITSNWSSPATNPSKVGKTSALPVYIVFFCLDETPGLLVLVLDACMS